MLQDKVQIWNNACVEINDLNRCIIWLGFYSHPQMIIFKCESFRKNTKKKRGGRSVVDKSIQINLSGGYWIRSAISVVLENNDSFSLLLPFVPKSNQPTSGDQCTWLQKRGGMRRVWHFSLRVLTLTKEEEAPWSWAIYCPVALLMKDKQIFPVEM